MLPKLSTLLRTGLSAVLMAVSVVHAQGVPIDDEALADVWGQAMFTLTNTTDAAQQLDFARITLNADIKLATVLGGLQLGQYARSGVSGTDIDITTLQFGNAATRSTVAITDPYVEFVYKTVPSDGSTTSGSSTIREVVGMRLGFGGLAGTIGMDAKTISGALQVKDAAGHTLADSLAAGGTGVRWDASSLSQLALSAGDASGASKDFFLSVLKSAVTFPTLNTSVGTSAALQAQAGFWMNWRDKLIGALK